LIFLIIFSWGCSTGSVKRDKPGTCISGKIEFPPAAKILLYAFSDSASLFTSAKKVIDSASIEKDGSYSIYPAVTGPVAFDLRCGDSTLLTNFLICPGDRLEINFKGKSNHPEIYPRSEEEKFAGYLVQFIDTFYRDPDTKKAYYISSNYMEAKGFDEFTRKRTRSQIDFFNRYFRDSPISDLRKSYAINTIFYEAANDKLMYLWKKRMKVEPVILDSAFLDFENPSFIENPDAFITPSYIRFINLYLKDTYERMVERGEIPADKTKNFLPTVEKFNLAHRLFRKPFLDAVLFNLLINDMKDVANKENTESLIQPGLDSLISMYKSKYKLK
jgi:hypothetical protein